MVKTLFALPILTNLTQHLVKIGFKLVLNSFSSLKLQNPRPGGGGYRPHRHVPRESPPPPPPSHFSDLATLLFRRRPLKKKTPFQKYTILCSAFPTWADRKDRRFKDIYVSLLFLTPKSPVFPVRGRFESTPPPPCIFSEGPLLKPPPPPPPIFKQCAANIYQFYI